MTKTLSILGLFVLVVALAILNLALREDPGRRNFEVMPGMLDPVPYESYSVNPNLPDGKTLQRPPAGTIVRGELPLHYGTTPEEAIRAGEELVNPIARDDARALERGAAVYATFCQVCHGPEGRGDGPVAQRGFPAPASLMGEKALLMRDGQMFHVLTYGQVNMPSYAAQISREDRWRVILHVRTMQQAALSEGSRAALAEAGARGEGPGDGNQRPEIEDPRLMTDDR